MVTTARMVAEPPLRIKPVAKRTGCVFSAFMGHPFFFKCFDTMKKFMRQVKAHGPGLGEPFPPLDGPKINVRPC